VHQLNKKINLFPQIILWLPKLQQTLGRHLVNDFAVIELTEHAIMEVKLSSDDWSRIANVSAEKPSSCGVMEDNRSSNNAVFTEQWRTPVIESIN